MIQSILGIRSVLALLIAVCLALAGCGPKNVQPTAADRLNAYVADANAQAAQAKSSNGSLWVDRGSGSSLFRDFKARQVNDLVTIVVSESMSASSAADASSSKDTKMQYGFNNLFGAEKKINELGNVVNGSGSSTFKGSGSTNRATTLNTTVSARVTSVLPNGYLLVEGVRQIQLNNENQTVYITGIVRPEDVTAHNIVASGAVAQMEVRVQGKGVVSQPINPGWLFRILNGILPF
jgi:flagellar L-ring protein FlgH